MAAPNFKKLRISEGMKLSVVNQPANFEKSLGEIPDHVKIGKTIQDPDQIHWFVKNRAQLEKELAGIVRQFKEGMILWIYYPKGTSGIQTDLTRDKGWESLLKIESLTWISLVSFDETWSVFGSRYKTESDKKKIAETKKREIFDYVDPVNKTVIIPDDLEKAFKKNKSEGAIFNALSFTNKKEYIEWIITAKQPETRKERVEKTIEKLSRGMKNPSWK